MKNIKKILLSLSSVAIASAPIAMVVACSDDEIGEKDIAMIISTKNNSYFVTLSNAAKVEAKKRGYNLHTYISNDDQSIESDKIDLIISQGFKTLILNGLDANQSAVGAKKAIDKGINVIALDRAFAKSANVWTTISSANKEGATKLAEKVLDSFKTATITPILFHLQGINGEQNGIDRWAGVQSAISAHTVKPSTTTEARANYERQQGNNKTGTATTSNAKINWINADNDEMALGAIAAVGSKATQIPAANKIVITGFDGTTDALKAVERGTLFGTVKQDAEKMGKMAIKAAIEASGGEDFSDITKGTRTKVDVLVITSSNISNFTN